MLSTVLTVLGLGALGTATVVVSRQLARRRLVRSRLFEREREALATGAEGSIRRWLFLAGYRDPRAPTIFWWLQGTALALGVMVAVLLTRSGMFDGARSAAAAVPGGLGELVGPVFDLSGALLVLLVGSLPLVRVRRARRRRADAFERDLPVALELLASLARSGLGFDASLARIVAAEGPRDRRPLGEELAGYRSDVLAGLPREESFRRLADRAGVPGVDIFVAAMTHSERLGVGLSGTLRRQADELWSVRRERALAHAQTLPARLAGPLIACFLPGLLIVTLGPALVRFWETVSGVTGGLQ